MFRMYVITGRKFVKITGTDDEFNSHIKILDNDSPSFQTLTGNQSKSLSDVVFILKHSNIIFRWIYLSLQFDLSI